MNNLLSKNKITIPLAVLAGQLAPIIFIYLDLSELGLEWTKANALDVYKSQKIYFFTSVAFPLFLIFILLLYKRTKKQKVFYQSILDDAQELVVVLDNQYNPIYKNSAFDRFGLDLAIFDLIKDKTYPQTFEFETKVNSEQRHLLCSATRSEARDEIILIYRDVTMIKVNAEKIKQQEESIMRSSQLASLGEVSSGIAHEINNPLGVILANTGIIGDLLESPSPQVLKCLATIERMGLRITGIIKAMKNLSRRSELTSVERIDLGNIIEDIINLSMPNCRKSDIELSIDLEAFKLKFVSGNSVQISQVLLNLVGNATQAIEALEDRWIKISLKVDQSFYQIIVENSGPQIHNEIQEKIFQPFYTTKSPGSGTGLGLSLSRTIAEIHKGSLVLDSHSKHPTFIFSIPHLVV